MDGLDSLMNMIIGWNKTVLSRHLHKQKFRSNNQEASHKDNSDGALHYKEMSIEKFGEIKKEIRFKAVLEWRKGVIVIFVFSCSCYAYHLYLHDLRL